MEANQSNNNNNCLIAPFVMKTYQMVSDPSTDRIIAWGRANNSFTVVDPLDFSQRILPAYFKHNNFSSFVRQLNTYGFRKVDPDKWEFANQWFLRGQKQLLCNITRRKHNKSINYNKTEMEMDEEELVVEVSRLREEQRQLEEELQAMHRRLEATERRPHQMMAFLYKVIDDPDIIPRMMLDKDNKLISHNNNRHLLNMSSSGAGEVEKKRRLMMISSATASSSSSSSSYSSSMAVSSSVKSEDDDDGAVVGVISSPDEPAPPLPRMDSQSPPLMYHYQLGVGGNYNYEAVVSPPVYGGGKLGFLAEAQSGYGGNNSPPRQPLPYPFSLFGGGF